MTIQNRLDLFVSTSMIQPEEAQIIQNICKIYLYEFNLDFSQEPAERFITHFVGMYQREHSKQSIEIIPAFVMDQLTNDAHFQKANLLLRRLVVEIQPPLEEEGYFLLHLIHFLGQQNGAQADVK